MGNSSTFLATCMYNWGESMLVLHLFVDKLHPSMNKKIGR